MAVKMSCFATGFLKARTVLSFSLFLFIQAGNFCLQTGFCASQVAGSRCYHHLVLAISLSNSWSTKLLHNESHFFPSHPVVSHINCPMQQVLVLALLTARTSFCIISFCIVKVWKIDCTFQCGLQVALPGIVGHA